MFKRILYLIICSFITINVYCFDRQAVKDSLQNKLDQTTDKEERYILLRQLADISENRPTQFLIFRQLYQEASKNNDEAVQIEALLELDNDPDIDSLYTYLSFAEKLPKNAASKGVVSSIKSKIASQFFYYKNEQEKSQFLQELINQHTSNKSKNKESGDIYELLQQVDIILIYLSYSMENTSYYEKYLNEFDSLIQLLPPENYYFEGHLYSRQAIVFSNRGESKKAIEADKKFLEYIHHLEKRDDSLGRIYRNYSASYFAIYRRILSNYKALTTEEVQYYYDEIKKLTKINHTVLFNFEKSGSRVKLYYYLATKNYKNALPIIDSILVNNVLPKHTALLYKIEITENLGMKEEQIACYKEYLSAIEKVNKQRIDEKSKELQFFYNLENINYQKIKLELENKKLQLSIERRTLSFILGISFLLIVLVVILLIYRFRDKKMTRSLQKETESLKKTQEELEIARDFALESDRMKTVFVQNMSHEIRTPLNAIVGFSQVIASEINHIKDDDDQLKIYSSLISKNSSLLLKLVNDLLQLSDFESGRMSVKIEECNPYEICQIAIKSIQHNIEPNVCVKFTSIIDNYFMFHTDPIRLQQLLINLLNNATKYTKEGEIILSYYLSEDKKRILFSVADTGIGIPPEKAEVIFQRFNKLDPFSQGNGLGLHICRMITKQLNGKVYLDISYKFGARFVIELPNE